MIGEAEAQTLAKDYALEKDEIAELGEMLENCAKDSDWPEVSPLLGFGLMWGEIELRWKIVGWMQDRRIKKILAANDAAQKERDTDRAASEGRTA